MDTAPITILHVDPDPAAREEVRNQITGHEDMELHTADSLQASREIYDEITVDCVISEYELPDGTSFDLFSDLRDHDGGVGCLLYTDSELADIETGGEPNTVVEFLSKEIPGTAKRVPDLVRHIVANRAQVAYPVPDNEHERLEIVHEYDLPGLESTEAFSRLTTLIRAYFDIDIAFVGLMKSHEEEIIACQGSNWSILSRENTVCTYAMLESDITVIEDVQNDPRFTHNDRLRELGVRSYAGANLTPNDDRVVGELCLIDDEPRSYSEQERTRLRQFADEVQEQLQLRRLLAESNQTMVGE